MTTELLPEHYDACEAAHYLPSLKWNLGAGDRPLDGYHNVDRKTGGEVYPLDCPDGSLTEIRASHVLEHFPHTRVPDVLRDWVRALAPGGCLKLAVPDFEKIARDYLAGKPIPVQAYVMGGNKDENDLHGAIFDKECLVEALIELGLERIGPWESEADDCASLPVSLNLKAYKPCAELKGRRLADVAAYLSAPRFGPLMHSACAVRAFAELGVWYSMGQGAYWHQVLSEQLEEALTRRQTRYVLTLDYDTVFSADDVRELYRLAEAFPEAHALCPVQMKRQSSHALFGLTGGDGKPRAEVPACEMTRHLLPICSGHFGLTLLRADRLRELPRPWFDGRPNAEGRWGDGRVDPDIGFWHNWARAGNTAFLAPRVVVGHLQEVIAWPGKDLKPVYQTTGEYAEDGIPAAVAR